MDELCVVAGTTIRLPIEVNDKDVGQKVRLTATGGPFVEEDGAQLIAPTVFALFLLRENYSGRLPATTYPESIIKLY